MDVHLGQELLDELGSTLENLETQQGALLQCLKDKGVVTEEELAPYLTQAGNASNVRWRAARLRLARILSGAQQKEEEDKKRQESPAAATQSAPEKESDQAGSAMKTDTKTEEQKKTEEKKTENEEAKSAEKDSESAGPSEAKPGEQTKPPMKEDAQPSTIAASTKEEAKPSEDRKEEAA